MKKPSSKRCIWGLSFVFCFLLVPGQAQRAEAPVPGEFLALEELLARAEAQNPELRAAAHELRAAQERVPPAGALPDPVITFGQMSTGNLRPLARWGEDEMSRISISVSQEFPLYGKRGLRERVVRKEADAEFWGYEFTRLRIRSDLKAAYYDLFFQHRTLETLRKNMRLLETFEETASALYRVGRAKQADVLRAQTELSRLQEQIELAEQRQSTLEAQINTLLHQPTDTPLPPPRRASRRRPSIMRSRNSGNWRCSGSRSCSARGKPSRRGSPRSNWRKKSATPTWG